MYLTMGIGATILLSLTLGLLPDPGAAQMGVNKQCQDCFTRKTVIRNNVFEMFIAMGVTKHEECPLQKLVRFVLEDNSVICAKEDLPKVVELVHCFREGRKCSDSSSSDSKQEFSKGFNVNPSATSAKNPITPLVTTKTTTQREEQTTLLPTKEPTMPIQTMPPVRGSDTDKGGRSLLQGQNEHPKPDQDEDPDGKMKNIAIISLVLIVLVMVAVGTGLYCRRKRNGNLQPYMPAPSQESIPVVEIP